jgi:flavin reductase (DIM6/NTAB) family NADH-FMN oxidoreductase RutF
MSRADIHLVNETDEIEHQFRSVVRRVAGGVSIITAGQDDDIAGMTVTSLTPLGANPPRLLVSINRQASSFELIERYRLFGISILNARTDSAIPSSKATNASKGSHGLVVHPGCPCSEVPWRPPNVRSRRSSSDTLMGLS